MIAAPGGIRQRLMAKVMTEHLRAQSKAVIVTASTGMGALQLPGGGLHTPCLSLSMKVFLALCATFKLNPKEPTCCVVVTSSSGTKYL